MHCIWLLLASKLLHPKPLWVTFLGGGGSLWLSGIVTVPTRILKKSISKKVAQWLVSNHP